MPSPQRTRAAERITAGQEAAENDAVGGNADAPPKDTGEALDDRFGLEHQRGGVDRPAALPVRQGRRWGAVDRRASHIRLASPESLNRTRICATATTSPTAPTGSGTSMSGCSSWRSTATRARHSSRCSRRYPQKRDDEVPGAHRFWALRGAARRPARQLLGRDAVQLIRSAATASP